MPVTMPEAAHYNTLTSDTVDYYSRTMLRKSSNMSSSSDSSLRKVSNDSGISVASSNPSTRTSTVESMGQYEGLIDEPRASTNGLSTAMLQNMLAQQQSLTAAAALNPAMFGLMSGIGGLWGNPLAAAMLQQEATARKLLESANNCGPSGKTLATAVNGNGCSGKQYGNDQFPGGTAPTGSLYQGFNGLMPNTSPLSDQIPLPDALRGQFLSRKLSEDISSGNGAKPTRKSHSFNGSSAMNRQFSPTASITASPNDNSRYSPQRNGDEQQISPYGGGGDGDSVCSGKSSVRSRTPQGFNQSIGNGQQNPYGSDPSLSMHNLSSHHQQSAVAAASSSQRRRRKTAIIGTTPLPDFSVYGINHPAFPSPVPASDIPLHKLSTASLPASLPSITPRNSVIMSEIPVQQHGSPATARKRSRNELPPLLTTEEKVGYHEDESYRERRRKNNEAAKRSRDSRRAKEDEIAIRAAFLEQENLRLRIEVGKLKDECAKLQTEAKTRKGVENGKVVSDVSHEEPAAVDDDNIEKGNSKPKSPANVPTPTDTDNES